MHAWTALHHVKLQDVSLQSVVAYESAKSVEWAHLREILIDTFFYAPKERFKGNDALAVLERKQVVVIGANVNWFELSGSGKTTIWMSCSQNVY